MSTLTHPHQVAMLAAQQSSFTHRAPALQAIVQSVSEKLQVQADYSFNRDDQRLEVVLARPERDVEQFKRAIDDRFASIVTYGIDSKEGVESFELHGSLHDILSRIDPDHTLLQGLNKDDSSFHQLKKAISRKTNRVDFDIGQNESGEVIIRGQNTTAADKIHEFISSVISDLPLIEYDVPNKAIKLDDFSARNLQDHLAKSTWLGK